MCIAATQINAFVLSQERLSFPSFIWTKLFAPPSDDDAEGADAAHKTKKTGSELANFQTFSSMLQKKMRYSGVVGGMVVVKRAYAA